MTNIIKKQKVKADGNKQSAISKKVYNIMYPVDLEGNPLPSEMCMISELIRSCRAWHKPLKCIWLCPAWYNILDSWMRRRAFEQQSDYNWNMLTWDGVEIYVMPKQHIIRAVHGDDRIDWDFYRTVVND